MLPSRSSPPARPIERRRHRRGPLNRLITGPVPSLRLGAGSTALGAAARRAWPIFAGLLVLGVAALIWQLHVPTLTPRHRAEALTFSLARAGFAPPMDVEPSAALVRGRYSAQTPAPVAVRDAMGFRDDMVMQERTARIGDYDVTVLWLRLPGREGGHWLVVAWMEGSDLALCSFRFTSTETDLTPAEMLWGQRLLGSILLPENFRLGVVPDVRLRGEPPKMFGPAKAS